MKRYLVGGAVRDALLGLEVIDRDWVVVGADPAALLAQGYQQVGKDFPVFLHPHTHEEYALARTEKKSGAGYTGFTCYAAPDVTLEEDLIRRDLTINAIAQQEDGAYIDPFGGKHDLETRLLRHISPAFAEDPLRILRTARFYARFAALGFTVAEPTRHLMQDMIAEGALQELTPERVWVETEKALNTEKPQRYFMLLHQLAGLQVVFKELNEIITHPQHNPTQTPLSTAVETGCHLLEKTASLTNNPAVRWAAFISGFYLCLHPLATDRLDSELRAIFLRLIKRLRMPNRFADLCLLSLAHLPSFYPLQQQPADKVLAFFDAVDIWRRPNQLDDLALIYRAACQPAAIAPFAHNNLVEQQIDALKQLVFSLKTLTVADIINSGKTGAAIKTALNEERKQRIALWQQQQQ
jgi:tRNA nucleotidyltransferase (CCA-adding enzyme)